MQWVFGGLIAVSGFVLLIAGVNGSGEQLYQSVTGRGATENVDAVTAFENINHALQNILNYPQANPLPGSGSNAPSQPQQTHQLNNGQPIPGIMH